MILLSIFCILMHWMSSVQCLLSNVSHMDFPEISEGQPCIKGKIYRISCNTCHCADNNVLYCTKMACLDDHDFKRYNELKNQSHRRNSREDPDFRRSNLPTLPKGSCIPGKIYGDGCRLCYCNDKGRSACSAASTTGCKELPTLSNDLTPNDFSPPLSNDEYWNLPILPHTAAKCDAGKMYMVDCNACLCMDNGNLLCEKMLCMNQDEEHEALAKKWSGAPCKKSDETLSNRCVRCSCEESVTKCRPVLGCMMPSVQKLHGITKVRLVLNTKKQKCKPGTVYKNDCNRCYCQPNRSLICTQKSCLNYQQAMHLKKQRTYLEKYGL